MTEKEKRGRGRPRGTGTVLYKTIRSIRFADQHDEATAFLAQRWGTTEAEAVRRAVLEMARREKGR